MSEADSAHVPTLAAAAEAAGVATSYVDGTGVVRIPRDSVLTLILDSIAEATSDPGATLGDSRDLSAEIPQSSDAPGGGPCSSGPQPARTWGVFTPLSALRRSSAPDHGSGDLTGLAELADVVEAAGGSVVGTLPLVARRPDEASPYSPLTRRFWDERWVDPAWVAEHLGVSTPAPRPAIVGDLADPEAAWTSTRAALTELLEDLGSLPAEVAAWRSDRPEVEQWARWKAAALVAGWDPTEWPTELATAVRLADDTALAKRGVSERLVDFEVFAQWAVTAQLTELGNDLRRRGMSLYLDLPVGTSASGYDAWVAPDAFARSMEIGAPPDRFFPAGQAWGLCPPQPRSAAALDDLRRCLDAHMAVCGLLRIDHVMGLHRLFWVASGAPADALGSDDRSDGTYVTYDASERWAMVAELSQHHGCGVVGEDLGTVPDEVRLALSSVGARGLFIGQDEVRAPFRLARPVPAASVASLNTHDLPPVAAWHSGSTIVSGTPVATVRSHLLGELALSDADIVIVSDQDLVLDDRRFNLPGEVGGATWRLRSRVTVKDLRHSVGPGASARTVLAELDEWRRTRRGDWPASVRPLLDSSDVASFRAGTHADLASRLGVHPRTAAGVVGVAAAVWAPHAREVAIGGEFDGWSGALLRRRHDDSGVWEGFVPSAMLGDRYKVHIRTSHGQWVHKSDPFARAAELPPGNASIITADDPAERGWTDHEWMAARGARQSPDQPMSIYELHLGSWRHHPDGRVPSYAEITPWLIEYVQRMGFTHVELMPVMEHPFGGSWGYHVTGYFAPTTRYGTPAEFASMVDALHRAGIGVILDWVPAHFPDDEHGLADFDGQALFEYPDPREGRHPEWGSRVFDWGRPEVRAFLVSSARWWIERFHIDGLRVDAVASMLYRNYGRNDGEWVANRYGGTENLEAVDFVRQLTHEIHHSTPGAIVIAEESTAWPGVTASTAEGGLGFDLKWDLGWMHDMLEYLARDPVHRSWHQDDLTFRAMYASSERFVLPLSHDEVVHGKASLVSKMAGDDWQRRANLRLLYGHQFTSPGVPLVFMGGELAMNEEWDHISALPWHLLQYRTHSGMQAWVAELNRLLRTSVALADDGRLPGRFEWIDCNDRSNSVIAWVRRAEQPGSERLMVANFTPTPHQGYLIGAPRSGTWHLIANSDEERWGGSDYFTPSRYETVSESTGTWQHSMSITLPPLALIVLSTQPPSPGVHP